MEIKGGITEKEARSIGFDRWTSAHPIKALIYYLTVLALFCVLLYLLPTDTLIGKIISGVGILIYLFFVWKDVTTRVKAIKDQFIKDYWIKSAESAEEGSGSGQLNNE